MKTKNNTQTKSTLAALAGLALAAGSAHAGTWASYAWNDDADLLLSSSTTYTHAIDFANGTTGTEVVANINGVSFTQYEFGGWVSGAKAGTDLTSGNGWSMTNNWGFNGSFGAGPAGTESAKLTEGFILPPNTVTGEWTLTLSGLSANTDYIFTLFSPMYDAGPRTATLDGLDDGVGVNVRSQTEDNTQVQYAYNTGAGTTFDLVVADSAAAYGFPAFTNEVVPEPSTTALLGLGGVALVLRRRK